MIRGCARIGTTFASCGEGGAPAGSFAASAMAAPVPGTARRRTTSATAPGRPKACRRPRATRTDGRQNRRDEKLGDQGCGGREVRCDDHRPAPRVQDLPQRGVHTRRGLARDGPVEGHLGASRPAHRGSSSRNPSKASRPARIRPSQSSSPARRIHDGAGDPREPLRESAGMPSPTLSPDPGETASRHPTIGDPGPVKTGVTQRSRPDARPAGGHEHPLSGGFAVIGDGILTSCASRALVLPTGSSQGRHGTTEGRAEEGRMNGRTDIQNGQVEFERAAAIDPLREPQHSSASTHGASDGEQLGTLRARLTATGSATVTEGSSNPRLDGTRHIPVAP